MAATFYILLLTLVGWFATGMDAFRPVNVVVPLRAIKKDDDHGGIRSNRPLMRNDRLEGIYRKSDQHQLQRSLPMLPPTLQQRQPHYVPRSRLLPTKQQQQQQQQQGFLRNANRHHPHRAAPVPSSSSHNNPHLGGNSISMTCILPACLPSSTSPPFLDVVVQRADHLSIAGGINPGRARLPQTVQHHHFQATKIPTPPPINNIKHHPHNHPTTEQTYNHQPEITHHQKEFTKYRFPEKLIAFVPATTTTISPPIMTTKRMMEMSIAETNEPLLLDPKYLLNVVDSAADDEYLTYLYLAPGDNRLEQEYLNAAANTGDMMMKKRPLDDHEIIMGSPSTNFDPYQSRGQIIRALPPYRDEEQIAIKDNENVVKLLEDDWIPIPSPWNKYRNNNNKLAAVNECNQC